MGGMMSKKVGWWTTLAEFFPPQPTFTVEQIPNLSGRVAIVTGGNSGIGYETVKALLQHDAKVYLAARSEGKAQEAIKSLKEITGKEASFLPLDLSDLASVKKAAEVYLSKEHELHILYNNAGVMAAPTAMVTKNGYDMQFGTNVIGHFLFTELLIPALVAGVASSPDKHTRVVTTSSSGAYTGVLDFDTFKDSSARRTKSPTTLYGQSKLGNAVVARQVAKRYADRGIISITLNPGNIQTDLARHMPAVARAVIKYVLYPAPHGALTQLFAGTMPEALNYNGEFMIPFARLGKCRPEMYDDELGDKLWQWLQQEVEPLRK